MRPDGVSGYLYQVADMRTNCWPVTQNKCWRCNLVLEDQDLDGQLMLCTNCGQLWTRDVNLGVGHRYHAKLRWEDGKAVLVEAVLHLKGALCAECAMYERNREEERRIGDDKWLKENHREPRPDDYDIDMGPMSSLG